MNPTKSPRPSVQSVMYAYDGSPHGIAAYTSVPPDAQPSRTTDAFAGDAVTGVVAVATDTMGGRRRRVRVRCRFT
ncbi:hypothetical protein [Streptomyces sp. NBC_00887]|uniref:hypothetical protein n=1 Tax=Streptomyces sp. NBC_00887 TaxID=2975859 RepID=UPI00386E17DC|nr:hypothetical protein OG844_10980 [Streptomyces sp. NBC_00887]